MTATFAEEKDPTTGNILAPVIAAAGFVGLGAVWAKFGREPKPDPMIGEYWREPLSDPPAVTIANLHKGTAPLGPAISATLIDLAQRGFLTISDDREQRLGPDRVDYHLNWGGKPTHTLQPYEEALLQHVFLGQQESSLSGVTAWARKNQALARAFAKDFSSKIGEDFKRRAYKQKSRGSATAWLIAIAAAVALGGWWSSRVGGNLPFIGYFAAVALFVIGAVVVVNRTKAGADAAARAKAEQKFLKDFSHLQDAPVGHLVLWERFLVDAVTLGVAKELLDGMKVRLPSVVDDPGFAPWYIGSGPGRLTHVGMFAQSFGASTAQAMAPSKSGGGGGFSGGGGGGGGGGGAGAR